MEIEVVVSFAAVEVARVRRRLLMNAARVWPAEPLGETSRERQWIVERAKERFAAFGDWTRIDWPRRAMVLTPPARRPAFCQCASEGDAPGRRIGGIEHRRPTRWDRRHLADMPPGRRRSVARQLACFDEDEPPHDRFPRAEPGEEEGAGSFVSVCCAAISSGAPKRLKRAVMSASAARKSAMGAWRCGLSNEAISDMSAQFTPTQNPVGLAGPPSVDA